MKPSKHWTLFVVSFFLFLAALYSADKTTSSNPYNRPLAELALCKSSNKEILAAIDSMPLGGEYSTSSLAMEHLEKAVTIIDTKLTVAPNKAEPSFCSGATYLVFLKTLSLLQTEQKITLSPAVLEMLLPKNTPDGEGLWGRWNANGPGTARLFSALKLGPNFSNIALAQPGDFLKIFWSDAVGAREHGHLVIFLGTEKKGNLNTITFWSSNKSTRGYGKKSVPLARVHRMIFSRLTMPQNMRDAVSLPKSDSYLASLLSRPSSAEEMKACCHLSD